VYVLVVQDGYTMQVVCFCGPLCTWLFSWSRKWVFTMF